jgi:hypothetical protein
MIAFALTDVSKMETRRHTPTPSSCHINVCQWAKATEVESSEPCSVDELQTENAVSVAKSGEREK